MWWLVIALNAYLGLGAWRGPRRVGARAVAAAGIPTGTWRLWYIDGVGCSIYLLCRIVVMGGLADLGGDAADR